MTNNSPSHNLEEILAGYVLGDLDEAELVWLNEELAANPELKEQVAQLKSALCLMPYGLPEEKPLNNIRSQILAQAKSKAISPKKYQWSWIISAVTAVSTLFLGVNNFGLRQQIAVNEGRLQQYQEQFAVLRQFDNRLVSLRANDHKIDTSGSLFVFPRSNTAVLSLKNLDTLSGNKVYRLWAVSQGKKIGCSNFKPNLQGEVHLNLSSDDALFNANSILITIEPKPDTEQPLGQEFLSGSYTEI